MKVLYLTNAPSPYRITLFEELAKYCDLDVCFELSPSEIKHRNISWYESEATSFSVINLQKIKIGNLYIAFDVLRMLKKKKYDVVVIGVYSTPTAILAMHYLKYKKIKFFINSDGGFIQSNEKWLNHKVKSYLIGLASAYLVSGKETAKYISYYSGKKQCIYQYTFSTYTKKDLPQVLLNSQDKSVLKKKLELTEPLVVLSVGQFIPRKGYDFLLRLCAELPSNIGVYLVGDEPTAEYLQLVRDLSLKNIHFLGFRKKHELMQLYQAADIFVLPTREDIWGLVINEALSYGLPVVTTERCLAGLELIKDDYNGFILPVDDFEKWNSMFKVISSNSSDINRMSENAFLKMRSYTIEKSAKEHYDAFNDFIMMYKK